MNATLSTSPRYRLHNALVALTGAWAMSTVAWSANPDKPNRLIVPFPPGGSADVMARGVAQRFGQQPGRQLGRQIVIDDHGGAGGIDAVEAAVKSGRLTYGSASNGSSSHLSSARGEALASVGMVHVRDKGDPPLLVDLLAGRMDTTVDSYTMYEEHIKAGMARPLGVTSKARLGVLPAAPTLAESDLKGCCVSIWLGRLAPAGTPKEVVTTLHAALGRTMTTPALRAQLTAMGIAPTFRSPEELAALLRAELQRRAAVFRKSGATVE